MSSVSRPVDLVELAARALTDYRAGTSEAMSEFVDRATPMLWQVARGQSLSASAAEDAVQQAWLRLIEQADRIDDPRGVLKWLMTTTRREAWRVAQRGTREDTKAELPEGAPSGADDVVDEVLATTGSATLWRHVRGLSERCQYLLRVIAFAEKPDYAAIAEALGMQVGSIGPTRGRCLAALRAALAADPTFDLGGAR